MSTFIKASFITRTLLLMFSCAAGSQIALGEKPGTIVFLSQAGCLMSADTTTTQTIVKAGETAPGNQDKKEINFQVNSAIEYLDISHFRNPEARHQFVKALEEEGNLKQISSTADSLRKVYATAEEDQKEVIAGKILSLERQMFELNNSLPAKYEYIRKLENDFWATASDDEISKFQEKIKAYRDSLQQIEILKNSTTESIDKSQLDTIDFYPATQKSASKAENNAAIIYKIQIGAYKGRVPDSASKLIKKLSVIRKIDSAKDEKGMTIYTTGSLKTYKEAETMRKQVNQEGVKNPVITAYKNGKKITVDEARKINNEL